MIKFNGKEVDIRSLEFGEFDYREENPWLESASYMDGVMLTDEEMDTLADEQACELHMVFMEGFLN